MNAPDEKQELRKLEGAHLYGYSSGVLAQIIPINVINAYIFIYYVYVVGLNALVVSIGTALDALIMGFASPFFGYIIDNKKPGKHGKRRPFLLYSMPFLVISVILIWYSPLTQEFGGFNFGITLFLFLVLTMFYLNFAMLRSSYLSMTPEQSQDEQNRIQIGSLIGIFSILGTILGVFIPLILQSQLINPDDIYNTLADKQYLMGALPLIGVMIAISIVVFTLLAYFSTNEDFLLKNNDVSNSNTETQSNIKNAFKNLFYPFSDKNYALFMFSILFGTIGIRIINKDLTLYLTFVLSLKESEFLTFMLPLIVFAVLGFFVWTKRAHNNGVKKAYIDATWIISISLLATAILLIEMPRELLLVLASICMASILFSLVVGYILPSPAISELIDVAPEEMLKDAKTDSLAGSYFGAHLFILNIANAIGDILIGIVLIGENAKNPFWIGILFPIAGFVFFISLLILKKVKLK